VFCGYIPVRLLLKHEIVLKDVPSSGTRVDSKWVEGYSKRRLLDFEVQKEFFCKQNHLEVIADLEV